MPKFIYSLSAKYALWMLSWNPWDRDTHLSLHLFDTH